VLVEILKLIAIACQSSEPDPSMVVKILEFVNALASECREKPVILLGGYWGCMRYVADQALKLGFTVVIMPPIEAEDREFPDRAIVLRTGLSYRLRSVAMVRSSDAVVVLGGASGTLQEAMTAYCEAKPLYVLRGTGQASDKLEVFSPFVDERRIVEVKLFDEPRALAEALCRDMGLGI